ncbi:glucodextranase DOMON-like domain-containing protein [Brachybacterium squillarum]|uniref:glucodextranase DOMON-like domain-containing protein n=1 Tax=Brachybacterium squillarum TaxID=661979 RepID=UPI002223C122|nr:glucodextranase DOMON-like domain-containing protein [Brachybacterium squillarum]MCW1804068.1 hypothetical protein [Brachybacterium squillarum]
MAAIPFVRPETATGTAKGERILRVEDPAGDEAGNIEAEATDWNVGGGSDGREDPNIIDLLVPEGTTQAEALAWIPASRVEVRACAYLDEETGKLVVVAIDESEKEQGERSSPSRSRRRSCG